MFVCQVIGKYIDDVDALGDIGSFNMNEIARVIAKNRSLYVFIFDNVYPINSSVENRTARNSQLFYDVKNTSLTLYDVTSTSTLAHMLRSRIQLRISDLQPDALCALGSLNPNLESVRLDYCGRMTDAALLHWSAQMPALARIELLGPFLVRAAAWISFFERSGARLRGFLITQSPRFDTACIAALAQHAPHLAELRLAEIGNLSAFTPHIATLSHLTALELSYPPPAQQQHSLNDEAAQALLRAVGGTLRRLDLSGNEELTDATLLDGVLAHVAGLESLALADVPLVTDQGVAELFNSWTANPPLEFLDLSRNHLPSSAALAAVLSHSASGLRELRINSWRETSNAALLELGTRGLGLVKVDLGWCRGVDDFVIKGLLDGCERLEEIRCYGCNRVTENCPRKVCVWC